MAKRTRGEQPLSTGACSLLRAYREYGSPDGDLARRSWRALRERVNHPDAEAREAWVAQLPERASGDELFYDDMLEEGAHGESWDASEFPLRSAAATVWLHRAKAVGASVGIAAAVLLGLRVAVISATTLTEQARGHAQEASYQGSGERERGRAGLGKPAAVPAKRKAPRAATAARVSPQPAPAEALAAQQLAPVVAAPVAKRRKTTKSARRKAPAVDDIAAETALVKQAAQAKNRGDAAEALSLLRQHAQRFPSGAMAQVRQVLRAEVLCGQGKKSEAGALVARFAAQHPGSALLGRMNRVCTE